MLALAQPGQWSLASWVDDSKVTVNLGNGRTWSPDNSDGRSHGTVRLIDALAQSYNQATVRVGMQVRPERLADLLRTLAGIARDRESGAHPRVGGPESVLDRPALPVPRLGRPDPAAACACAGCSMRRGGR
jgi:membrane peptidoglycan carboxypeptidase